MIGGKFDLDDMGTELGRSMCGIGDDIKRGFPFLAQTATTRIGQKDGG